MLYGQRVRLEPLRVEHADELMPVLDDSSLHTFVGGEPADLAQLRARYTRQVVGRSPDGAQRWLNWLGDLTRYPAMLERHGERRRPQRRPPVRQLHPSL